MLSRNKISSTYKMKVLLLFGIVAVALAGTTRFQGYVLDLCLSKKSRISVCNIMAAKITQAALIMLIMIMIYIVL